MLGKHAGARITMRQRLRAGLRCNRRANRAPCGRTVFPGSAPRGAATPPSWCGQPYGLADSRFEPLRGDSTAGALAAPLRSVPFCSAQSGNPRHFWIRQGPPGRRPRSCCRVLNGPAGRSLAGARRPSILALLACLPAGGAKNERPPGAPSCLVPRGDIAARRRSRAVSLAGRRIPAL